MSETSKRRHVLAPYCAGPGVDVGFGGDPILPTSICVDLPQPYTRLGLAPQHLACDGLPLLPWFADRSLGYVYSSHLIEDFPFAAQLTIVREWLRKVRSGGRVVILAPDQQAYERHCRDHGTAPNSHHAEPDMGLASFAARVVTPLLGECHILHHAELVAEYSFEVVLQRR